MEQKILLATQDFEWAQDVKSKLEPKNIVCEMVSQGKESQLLLYRQKFNMIFLNPDITNHSGVEVLKFIKLNQPSLKVALLFANEERSREYDTLVKNSAKVGINKVFVGPVPAKTMLDFILDNSPGHAWKNGDQVLDEPQLPDERIKDRDCTQVDIEAFYSGNLAIFDYYLRLKENHFVKIVKRGENIDPNRIKKLQQGGVKQFFFLTKERRNYINYMNEILKTSLTTTADLKVALHQVSNVSDILMEEIHSRGLKPELVEEGKSLSNNLFSMIKGDNNLRSINNYFTELGVEKLTHSFLTSFFTAIICKNLDWAGPKTIETVVMGALIHDIGLLKLPPEIRNKNPEKMTAKEFELYQDHPRLGANMLLQVPHLNPQIVQIVYQHHENNTGSGYPNELSSLKIYPLAKIIALADEVAESVSLNLVSPLDAVKMLLRDRDKLINFDPIIIKALVAGFVKGSSHS